MLTFRELVESVLLLEVSLSKANRIRFTKQFNTDLTKANEYINRFNDVVLKLTNKDIFSYKSLEDLEKALEGAQSIKTKRELALQGSKIFYENDDYILRLIRSKDAAIAYGKGANWCISYDDSKRGEDENTGNLFKYHALDLGYTIYIAEVKKLPLDKELKKIALLIDKNKDCEVWSADNNMLYNSEQTYPFSNLLMPGVHRVYNVSILKIIQYIPYTKEEKRYIKDNNKKR